MNKIKRESNKMIAEIDNLFSRGNINEIGFARCIYLMLYNNYILSCTIESAEISTAEIAYLQSYGCKVKENENEIIITL